MWSFISEEHEKECRKQCKQLGLQLPNQQGVLQLPFGDFSMDFDALASQNTRNLPSTLPRTKSPTKLYDVTAGLGRDSFFFALKGYQVLSFESNPLLALLLHNAMQRSHNVKQLNWQLQYGSCETLLKQTLPPDILYFDPMFEKEKSAKPKKYTQVIQYLQLASASAENTYAFLQHFAKENNAKLITKQPKKSIATYIQKPYQIIPCGKTTVCLVQTF